MKSIDLKKYQIMIDHAAALFLNNNSSNNKKLNLGHSMCICIETNNY